MTVKKIIIGLLFCLVAVCIFGQDVCMYAGDGQKVCYEVSATRILVKSETLDITDIENALRNPVAGSLKNIYDMGDKLFFIEMQNTTKEDMWELQRQFRPREDVTYTSPVFGGAPGSGYANDVIVKLKSQDDYPVLQEYADVYRVKDIKSMYGDIYILTLPHNPEKDAMQTALELYETGFFHFAEFNGIWLCPFEWCPFGPEGNGNINIVSVERTIAFYPNPANDILYVDLENKTSIRLYNSLGKLCRQAKTTGGTVELSVSNLPNGIYFLNIRDESASKSETHKIIVKH
jgi:hypothetical protein